jgi:uncharacterized protein (DUF362 family)
MTGRRKKAGVTLAGTNRVAVDCVGLACLERLGSNRAIMDTPIFEQFQITRAVELGLGPGSPDQIKIRAADETSLDYASAVSALLSNT